MLQHANEPRMVMTRNIDKQSLAGKLLFIVLDVVDLMELREEEGSTVNELMMGALPI